ERLRPRRVDLRRRRAARRRRRGRGGHGVRRGRLGVQRPRRAAPPRARRGLPLTSRARRQNRPDLRSSRRRGPVDRRSWRRQRCGGRVDVLHELAQRGSFFTTWLALTLLATLLTLVMSGALFYFYYWRP